MALDAKGNIVIASAAHSPDFPVTPGAAQTRLAGNADAFIVKLLPHD